MNEHQLASWVMSYMVDMNVRVL